MNIERDMDFQKEQLDLRRWSYDEQDREAAEAAQFAYEQMREFTNRKQ